MVAVRMARRAGNPETARQRWQGGVEQNLSANPLPRLGRITNFHSCQEPQVVRRVKTHGEIEGVVNVDGLAVRTGADSPRVLANSHGRSDSLDLLVIVV